jgi:hypothetical protein
MAWKEITGFLCLYSARSWTTHDFSVHVGYT